MNQQPIPSPESLVLPITPESTPDSKERATILVATAVLYAILAWVAWPSLGFQAVDLGEEAALDVLRHMSLGDAFAHVGWQVGRRRRARKLLQPGERRQGRFRAEVGGQQAQCGVAHRSRRHAFDPNYAYAQSEDRVHAHRMRTSVGLGARPAGEPFPTNTDPERWCMPSPVRPLRCPP